MNKKKTNKKKNSKGKDDSISACGIIRGTWHGSRADDLQATWEYRVTEPRYWNI